MSETAEKYKTYTMFVPLSEFEHLQFAPEAIQSFNERGAKGEVFGEIDEPITNGLSEVEKINRFTRVDPKNISHSITNMELRPEYGQLSMDVTPCGPYASRADELLLHGMVKMAIRATASSDNYIIGIITFDLRKKRQ